MSKYEEYAEKAATARKYKAPRLVDDESNQIFKERKKGLVVQDENIGFFHEITPQVNNLIKSQLISKEEVLNCCEQLRSFVQCDFKNLGVVLERMQSEMGKDVCSVNNATFERRMYELKCKINAYAENMLDFEEAVRNRVDKVRTFQDDYLTYKYYISGTIYKFD